MKNTVNSRWWKVLAVLCALYLAAQVLPASRLAYNPQEVRVEGEEVTMYRAFPGDALNLPRPRISYVETVAPLTPDYNQGHVCQDRAGPFRYDDEGPLATWELRWAEECLGDPIGYMWSAAWTWHLGVFEFGPVTHSKRVLRTPEEEQ